MRYPLIIIPGEPYNKEKTLTQKQVNVPCPHCLKPIILTLSKLEAIFLHYFIADENEELDVMCFQCIDDLAFDERSSVAVRKRIKVLEID